MITNQYASVPNTKKNYSDGGPEMNIDISPEQYSPNSINGTNIYTLENQGMIMPNLPSQSNFNVYSTSTINVVNDDISIDSNHHKLPNLDSSDMNSMSRRLFEPTTPSMNDRKHNNLYNVETAIIQSSKSRLGSARGLSFNPLRKQKTSTIELGPIQGCEYYKVLKANKAPLKKRQITIIEQPLMKGCVCCNLTKYNNSPVHCRSHRTNKFGKISDAYTPS